MKLLISSLGLISLTLAVNQTFAYDCAGLDSYSDGANYNAGQIIQNQGNAYKCDVGGWCSIGDAYAPGAGWAWQHAWSDLGACSGGSGSSSSSSSSSSTTSGGGSTGTCANWAAGTNYNVGDVVVYLNNYYVAVNANPGYDPSISTWFWDPTTSASCSGSSSSTSSSSSGGTTGGSCPAWAAGQQYNAGDIVSYQGSNFIAVNENPGYDPIISTWFWDPTSQSCGGTSSSSSSSSGGSTGTGFSSILSQEQFDQMFPSRNPFYTYQGLVEAANFYSAFAGTGDLATKQREVAAAMANFHHETGGLVHITEIAQGSYCSGSSTPCGICAPGKSYYGRGPIQLSWNYNYCTAGQALGLDLWSNPDQVAQNAATAWKTALWYWMTQSGPGNMPAHQCITSGQGFGCTIRSINGSLECDGGHPAQVQSRVNLFSTFKGILGTTSVGTDAC